MGIKHQRFIIPLSYTLYIVLALYINMTKWLYISCFSEQVLQLITYCGFLNAPQILMCTFQVMYIILNASHVPLKNENKGDHIHQSKITYNSLFFIICRKEIRIILWNKVHHTCQKKKTNQEKATKNNCKTKS